MRIFVALFFLFFYQTGNAIDGVDLRLGIVNGSLDFTSVSGIQRNYRGIGSELGILLPLYEKKVLEWVWRPVPES